MTVPRILLVEDDAGLVELFRYNLLSTGYDVIHTDNGREAIAIAASEHPDLVILDWMIAGGSGIEVCRQLRNLPGTASLPIIMVTAKSDESDRILGLESGADDYMTKPFSPRELVARVQNVLRRLRPNTGGLPLRFADIILNTGTFRAWRAGRPLQLGPTEFRLLRHFLENPTRVFSREQLLAAVWGRDVNVELRTIDVHIRRLRKAINGGCLPDLIRTVRSHGYALDDDFNERVPNRSHQTPGDGPSRNNAGAAIAMQSS